MPEQRTLERARQAKRQGKRPTTQASEFVREEMHHIREGKHGARSTKQAIAIGLSKARRAGVKLGPAPGAPASRTTRRQRKSSPKRSRAMLRVLEREPRRAATRGALARQARASARRRGPAARKAAARKAVATKGREGMRKAARKAAATRKAA
ncbi:MAG TPA: DUF6496 domain-containing protein [Methylomirabilota bacterium]|jgi:hypothetical protein